MVSLSRLPAGMNREKYLNHELSTLLLNFQVLISPFLMYPTYKWGWKFLWLLPVYIVGIEVWTFVLAMQNEYKAARLLMFVI